MYSIAKQRRVGCCRKLARHSVYVEQELAAGGSVDRWYVVSNLLQMYSAGVAGFAVVATPAAAASAAYGQGSDGDVMLFLKQYDGIQGVKRLSRCFLNTQRCLLLIRSELEESRVLREKDKLRYEVMLREAEGEKGKLLRQV